MLFESDASNWYAIDVAVGAGFVSIMAAFFTGAQWWEARRTRLANERAFADQSKALAIQAETMSKQAEAAERAATAAERSMTEMKALSETRQRAWITFLKAELIIDRTPSTPIPYLVVVTVKNGGLTPAIQMETEIDSGIDGISKSQYGLQKRVSNLGPENSTTVRLSPNLSAQDLGALNRDSVFIVWGNVKYKDVFGADHITKWRVRYWPLVKEFLAEPTGNDSD